MQPATIPVHYRPGDPAPSQLIAELGAAGADIDVAVLAGNGTPRVHRMAEGTGFDLTIVASNLPKADPSLRT
jgi:hypothetical protein